MGCQQRSRGFTLLNTCPQILYKIYDLAFLDIIFGNAFFDPIWRGPLYSLRKSP